MNRIAVALLLLAVCSSAQAQILVPDVIAPHEPIVVGCDCIVPKNGTVQFMWRTSPLAKAIHVNEGRQLHIWAPPGEHWIENLVVTQTFKDVVVIVPDPMFPNDFTKAKAQTIKVQDTFDVARYEKTFKVSGTPPTPPGPGPGPDPNPTPTPTPTPDTEFAKQAQTWLKAIPAASYNKAKAEKLGDNFIAVAAQAVATSGWDLAAFNAKTKELNQQTLTLDEQAAWANPFFKPLAMYQAALFQARGLSNTDAAGIAKLWRESGEAIKKAAF